MTTRKKFSDLLRASDISRVPGVKKRDKFSLVATSVNPEIIGDQFKPVPTPQANDWLANQKEPGQVIECCNGDFIIMIDFQAICGIRLQSGTSLNVQDNFYTTYWHFCWPLACLLLG